MKKIRNLTIIIFISLGLSSCINNEDSATVDNLVGTYSISAVEYVTWGYSSGTMSNSGMLTISKISGNRIQTSGFFSTTGTVSGNTLFFEAFNSSDAYGYITYSFSSATLSGNVMTFTIYASGQLADNGVMYPYRMTSNVTAIKIS